MIYEFLGKEESSGFDCKTKKGLLIYLIEEHGITSGKKHKCHEVYRYLVDRGYLKEEDSGASMVPVCGLLKDAKNHLKTIIEGQPTVGYCFKGSYLGDEAILRIINSYPDAVSWISAKK